MAQHRAIYGGDFAKFCGLLRIYELYFQVFVRSNRHPDQKYFLTSCKGFLRAALH